MWESKYTSGYLEHSGIQGLKTGGNTWASSDDIQDYLAHFGILGMKWGQRRYQNEDGSLTAAGRSRYYGSNSGKSRLGDAKGEKKSWSERRAEKKQDKEYRKEAKRSIKSLSKEGQKKTKEAEKDFESPHKNAKGKVLADRNGLLTEEGAAAYNRAVDRAQKNHQKFLDPDMASYSDDDINEAMTKSLREELKKEGFDVDALEKSSSSSNGGKNSKSSRKAKAAPAPSTSKGTEKSSKNVDAKGRALADKNGNLTKRGQDAYMDAYNRAADIMNNGKIKAFNDKWNKSHPNSDYGDDYMDAYQEYFNSFLQKELKKEGFDV